MSKERRLRWTRTIVVEGPESWVRRTLENSYLPNEDVEPLDFSSHGSLRCVAARIEQIGPQDPGLIVRQEVRHLDGNPRNNDRTNLEIVDVRRED